MSPSCPLPRCAALCVALFAAPLAAQEVLAAHHPNAAAQDVDAKARAGMLRASIVLKIAPYLTVEGAPARSSGYRIGIIGTDPVAVAAIANLPGKKVDGATVSVVEISLADALAGKTSQCDVVYIAASVDTPLVKTIVAANAQRPVPFVCERAGFAKSGGGVQMFVQDNVVRFEINAEALKEQGVRVSPQLLKLSRKGPE